MKRVRCPKCDEFITFDETIYKEGQSLVFECPQCGKQFGIRIGTSKLRATQKEEKLDELSNENGYGSIVVIENVFHYKQVLPLKYGDEDDLRYFGNAQMCQSNLRFKSCTMQLSPQEGTANFERNKQHLYPDLLTNKGMDMEVVLSLTVGYTYKL